MYSVHMDGYTPRQTAVGAMLDMRPLLRRMGRGATNLGRGTREVSHETWALKDKMKERTLGGGNTSKVKCRECLSNRK